MFSQASVILSTGGCVADTPQADTPWADTPGQTPPGQIPPGRHPQADTPWAGTPLGRHPPLPSTCWDTPHPCQCKLGYTTLLECILVPSLNANVVQTRGHFQLSNAPHNIVIALVIFLLTCFHRVALKRKMKCVWHNLYYYPVIDLAACESVPTYGQSLTAFDLEIR